MKASAIVTALALLFPIISFGVVDPFEVAPDPPRPERVIERLPKSISYRQVEDGQHVYVISGIYATSPKQDIEDLGSLLGNPLIPDCLTCTFDFKKLTCTFTTSRKLTYSELAYALDDIAELGGDMPYWAEVEARDLEDTKEFKRIRYEIEEVKKEPPAGLAWFWIQDDQKFQIPLSLGGFDQGSLLVVPSTALCMCHSRFIMRILDPKGMVIWKQTDAAYGSVRIALSSDEELGMHKVWLHRSDHGANTTFVITGSRIQE
jgi:hypothetical protein